MDDVTQDALELVAAECQIKKYMDQFNITRGAAMMHLDDYDFRVVAQHKLMAAANLSRAEVIALFEQLDRT
jgi:hypothetical protein